LLSVTAAQFCSFALKGHHDLAGQRNLCDDSCVDSVLSSPAPEETEGERNETNPMLIDAIQLKRWP
jgi:hypothetical protein